MSLAKDAYDTEKLAKHMAGHHSPYSPGVTKGGISGMISCIRELVLDG